MRWKYLAVARNDKEKYTYGIVGTCDGQDLVEASKVTLAAIRLESGERLISLHLAEIGGVLRIKGEVTQSGGGQK